jgi:ATP adenylyltransferase
MPEFWQNIWAPWREEYIRQLDRAEGPECFLCRYRDRPEDDERNHVLWRTPRSMVVFNRYPYTNGHLLIAIAAHKAGLSDLDDGEALELMRLLADAQSVLCRTIHPQGFNVGLNVGHCAGAGLPDHLHLHLVPRWSGDTNFMTVMSDVRVILQSLDALYARLREASAEMGLPRTT